MQLGSSEAAQEPAAGAAGSEIGLFRRAVRGGAWLFGLTIVQEIIAIARLIVLARLLSPNDFGLAGVAVLALSTIDTLTQPNFDSALIQMKADPVPYLHTAWSVGVLRGIAVAAVLFLAAPVGAAFFGAPDAAVLVRVIAATVLARAFTSIGVVRFRRDIRFDRQFIWQFTGRLADLAVAIAAALALGNALALVLAFLAGDVAKMISSYALDPYRPRFQIDWRKARELFDFGKWLLGLAIIAFLLTQGDSAVVARVIGPAFLGLYQLARRVANVPATEISHVIAAVTLPAFSRLQDDLAKLAKGYLMVLEVTALVALPLAGAVLTLGADITAIFFGPKWAAAVPAMRVLAVWGAISAIEASAEPALIAIGRPRKLTKYQAIQLVVLAIAIYPATRRFGIAGTSLAVVAAAAVPSYLAVRQVTRVAAISTRSLLGTITLPLAATALAATAAWGLGHWGLADARALPRFAAAIAVYAAVYAGAVWGLGSRFNYNVGATLREAATAVPIGRRRGRT